MLRAIPKHWLSWDFVLQEDGVHVAALDISWFREKGELVIGGSRFEIGRQGLMSGPFLLSSEGRTIATATKPSVFRRSFEVVYGREKFTLQASSLFSRKFELRKGTRAVGFVTPEGVFTRRASVALPEELPLEVRVFLTWLVVLLWKRQQQSS